MVKLQMIVVLTVAIVAVLFWPTTFRAYIVRDVMAPYTGLQPYVAGRSDLEVFQGLWRPYSVKTSPIVTTICVCLLLGVSEMHMKLQLISSLTDPV